MKIIFLDIDGVLVTREMSLASEKAFPNFEPSCVRFLNALIQRTRAKIIISSTWRYIHPKYLNLIDFLKDQGVQGEVIGFTPNLPSPSSKTLEIQAWLSTSTQPESFIIIDDDIINDELQDHWIWTDMENGFQKEHFEQALKILEKDKMARD